VLAAVVVAHSAKDWWAGKHLRASALN
jgi:hypothetical protein